MQNYSFIHEAHERVRNDIQCLAMINIEIEVRFHIAALFRKW